MCVNILHLTHGKRESFLLGVRCKKGSPWRATFAVTYDSAPFLRSFLQGQTVSRAAELANAAAGVSVTRPSDQNSVPPREEVDRFLRSSKRWRTTACDSAGKSFAEPPV